MKNEEKISGIYRIHCLANGKSYYGQTDDYKRRMIEHKKNLRHKSGTKHHCVHLQNAWNKYGESQFEFSLAEKCPVEFLTEREQWYFDTYGPQDLLFNTARCAEAPRRGIVLTEETKKKLSDLNSGENHPMWGKSLSEEVRKKISDSKIGEKHPQFGKPVSNEIKEKIRNSLNGDKCHLAKLDWETVRQIRFDFINGAKSASQITEKLSMNKTTIYDVLNGVTWKDDSYNTEKAKSMLEQGNKIVNPEIVKQIREEYKTTTLQFQDLAKKYNLSVRAYGKIIRNETWFDEEYGKWKKQLGRRRGKSL